MEAILKFNLPEEKDDFVYATKGLDYLCALAGLREKIRSKLKYGDLKGKDFKCWESFEAMFFQELEERNIDLNDLK